MSVSGEPRLAESSILSERAQIPDASVIAAVTTAAREEKRGKIFLEHQRCLFGFGTQKLNPSQNIYNLKNIFIIMF